MTNREKSVIMKMFAFSFTKNNGQQIDCIKSRQKELNIGEYKRRFYTNS
jgi:hypothetical protein